MIHRISNITYRYTSKYSFLTKSNRNDTLNKFSKDSIKPIYHNKRFLSILRKNNSIRSCIYRKYHTSTTKLDDSDWEQQSSDALPIFELSPETFRDELTASEIPLIVEFYLPE